MNTFIIGISTIGNFFPKINEPVKTSPWQQVANDFYFAGENLREAINESKILYAANEKVSQSKLRHECF